MEQVFSIAGMDIKPLINGNPVEITKESPIYQWTKYKSDHSEENAVISLLVAEQLPEVGGKSIWTTDTCKVKVSGDYEIRIYRDGILHRPYGIYSRDKDVRVIALRGWLEKYMETNQFFNILGLEYLLMKKSKLIFHCCYIDIDGEAILFSGPSGIGKSTQGELWRLHQQAEVINGDRCVLGLSQERLWAYGFPFSGTSGICQNKNLPVKAVVFLKQGLENEIRTLERGEASRLFWEQTTVNQWNGEFVDEIISLIERIVDKVPVFELTCRPDEEAVHCLKAAITK